jgi:hypothetical protein
MRWKQDEPRRNCIHTLENFCRSLQSGDSASLLNAIVLPQAIAHRTGAEQSEFLFKALRDEISPDGLAALSQRGKFGPLKEIFPAEAARWAQMTGVKVDDCVAFRLDQVGLRTEVVLVGESPRNASNIPRSPLRIVRCNNVRVVTAAKL